MKLSIKKFSIRTHKPIDENRIYFYGAGRLPCFIHKNTLIYEHSGHLRDVDYDLSHQENLQEDTLPLTERNLMKYFNIKSKDEYEIPRPHII